MSTQHVDYATVRAARNGDVNAVELLWRTVKKERKKRKNAIRVNNTARARTLDLQRQLRDEKDKVTQAKNAESLLKKEVDELQSAFAHEQNKLAKLKSDYDVLERRNEKLQYRNKRFIDRISIVDKGDWDSGEELMYGPLTSEDSDDIYHIDPASAF